MSLVKFFDALALDTWNPFSIFGTTVNADAWLASDTSAFADTYIESRETAEAYVFSARLPAGVRKEEVKVDVDEGNVLVIAGERSLRREAKSDGRHRIERTNATFFGRFHLPEDAAVDRVRAAMDDGGALTVTVPRAGAVKAEVKVDVDEGNVLVIAGERSLRREAKSDGRHRIERTNATSFGRFHLPEDAAVDRVSAAMDDGGALTVTVPRAGAVKAEAKAVEASPC